MIIEYSSHAIKRIKQRGITKLEVEYVIKFPKFVKKSFDKRKEIMGEINHREIKVVIIEKESYINVITVI